MSGRRFLRALGALDAVAPHEAVGLAVGLAAPERRRALRALRTAAVESPNAYSAAPFIEKRAIFVHVPKCAGVSVAQGLFGCRGAGHATVTTYKIVFSRAEFESFFKFTFVRNPWDRLVSSYYFLRDGGLNSWDRAMAERHIRPFADFGAFVRGFAGSRPFYDFPHFRPQTEFLCPSAWSAPQVDFIGRVETLDADFRHLAERLGVDAKPPGANRGASRPQGWRESYDAETREIASRIYARDIALFGYAF